MKKCKFCGHEFQGERNRKFCSPDCKYEYDKISKKFISKAQTIAKKFDFELKNEVKIAKAKMMLFRDGNLMRCPCDSNNPDRFCGSARCIADTVYKGHCHCNLFHSKKEPLLK